MINIAICDDDPVALSIVSGGVKSFFSLKNLEVTVKTYPSALELEKNLQHTAFDLFLLDVMMPGMDGIEFGRKLRAGNDKRAIIYISSREDKVFESLETSPCAFVRKDCFLQDLDKALNQYMKTIDVPSAEMFVVKTRTGIFASNFYDIIYIESDGRYQYMCLKGKEEKIEILSKMEDLEKELTPKGFLRIHKGCLVNYRYIQRIDKDRITLSSGQELFISRLKVKKIQEQYFAFCHGRF
jgi:DNA-binding LytR/AlgR family response regulator